MKKLSAFIAVIVVLLFSACARQREPEFPEFLTAPYRFTADFTMENLTGRLIFTRYSPQDMTLEFLAPDALAGMVITIKEDEFILQYRDIPYRNLLDNLGRTHPALALYTLLMGSQKPVKTTAAKTSGLMIFVYEDGAKITASDTALVSVEASAYGLELTVTEFKLLAEK